MTVKHTLIPYMCDHSYVLQAAMEYFGTPSEVLPPADEESATLGVNLVLGKECTPCAYVVGDLIRRLRKPDLDPCQTAILLTTAEGPCRYGQYHVLLRHILNEQGFSAVEIVSPSASNSYQGIGEHPLAFRLTVWRGLVALDLLQALCHHFRPYEVHAGESDALYQKGLDLVVAALRRGGGPIRHALREIGEGFRALPVNRSEPRPQIGIVGEIFVRQHWPSNRAVIRRIEELGGEAILANMMEYLYYTNWWYMKKQRQQGNWGEVATTFLTDLSQRFAEFQLTQPIADILAHRFESQTGLLMRHTANYMDPTISTEAVISIGKAVELAHQGVSGILNVLPFTCMPGTITAGLSPRVRRDLDDIPWLDLSYDMQQSTNIQTRLEAFMYQAHHFQQRQGSATH